MLVYSSSLIRDRSASKGSSARKLCQSLGRGERIMSPFSLRLIQNILSIEVILSRQYHYLVISIAKPFGNSTHAAPLTLGRTHFCAAIIATRREHIRLIQNIFVCISDPRDCRARDADCPFNGGIADAMS